MKHKNNIVSFIKTIILASAIIVSGYTILAKAGNYIIRYDNTISAISNEKSDSYVFYSQADSDVTLFPWNYEADAVTYSEYYYSNYAEYESKIDSSYDASFSSIVDTSNLYDYLRYFFYRTISSDVRRYMSVNDVSLSSVMNFDNLEDYISIYPGNTSNYYFYKGRLNIDNHSYNLDFSFNDSGFLYSFQCQEIHNSDNYNDDVMTNGNKVLSNLVSEKNSDTFLMLVNDIVYLDDKLKNYFLNISSSDISINLEDEAEEENRLDISINYTSEYFEKYIANYESSKEYANDEYNIFSNDDQNSYQIVKASKEYLLILSDSNIVLHYDPLLHVFNGFNLSETY